MTLGWIGIAVMAHRRRRMTPLQRMFHEARKGKAATLR